MNVLAIETSQPTPTAAMSRSDGSLIAAVADSGSTSESLAGIVASILTVLPRRIDRIAVSNGPGSQTGLRVGKAFAAGLADSFGLALCEVSLSEALAVKGGASAVWIGNGLIQLRSPEGIESSIRPEDWEIVMVSCAPSVITITKDLARRLVIGHQSDRIVVSGNGAEAIIRSGLWMK